MRLLRNLILSYTMSCEQAKAFAEEVEFTEAKVEVAVLLFAATHDRERYDLVLSALRFEEQRNQVRKQCGFGDAVPAPTSAPAPALAKAAGPAKDATSWMRKKKDDSDDDDD